MALLIFMRAEIVAPQKEHIFKMKSFLKSVSIFAVTATILAACAGNVKVNDHCSWVNPIYISQSDVLSDGTARQILTHNQTWSVNCK